MKRTFAVVALFGAFASFAQTRELTVEPGGLGPAAALSQIKAWRVAKDMSPVTVRVRKGVYRLAAPLVFNLPRTDSNITWEGEDGAVFSGGWKLGPWRERDGVLVAKVPAGRWFEQFFVNGRRAERSRYPNEGWLAPSSPTQAYLPSGRCADFLTFTNAEVRAGLKSLSPDELRGAQLRIVHKWAAGRYVLGGYDSELGTLTVFGSRWPGWKQWNEKETRCAFENVRFGFDAPGEWFLDGAAGEVLYRPLPGETTATLEAIAPCDGLSTIVRIEGESRWDVAISNVVFRNIVFAHTAGTPSADSATGQGPSECDMFQAASTSDGAIELSYVKDVVFDRCRVEHTGNHGIRWRDGCVRNKVRRCTFSDCGAGGIWMGMDNPAVAAGEELTRRMITTPMKGQTAFNEISDCLFTGGGRFNMEGVGVCLTHCSDTKVVHNEVRDNFYSGMSIGWTWGYKGSIAQRNEIAYNLIWDIGKGVMSDMGGIYLLGTAFGTKVHHNVIHDVSGLTYGGWGIYLDEGSEGVTVSDNLTYDTMDGGMNQHYGVGCEVRNNIFGPNRTKGVFNTARQEAQDVPSTIDFIGNICYTEEGPLFAEASDGVLGARDLNLVYRTDGKGELGGKDFAAWQASGRGKGNVYADPLFVDAAKRDFRLRPESPAFKLGFRPWDCTTAGVRTDITRKVQAEIDAAAKRGGGTVTVGSGEHFLVSLFLRDGVTLRFAKGAHVFASRAIDDYPRLPDGRPAGVINIRGVHNVAVIGETGSFIDGGNCYDPNGPEGYRGPHCILSVGSTNVTLRGLTVIDSGDYGAAFLECRDTRVEDMTVLAGHDGIHHDICDGVRIFNCKLWTGDDSVAGACCTDVVISNCALSSACSPIRYGGRDVLITDCRVTASKYPHRWTLTEHEKRCGAGPDAVGGRRSTGCLYQTYTGDTPIAGFRPGNIVLRNITAECCDRLVVSLSGIPGAIWQNGVGIPDVTFENLRAKWIKKPSVVIARENEPLRLTFRNCSIMYCDPQVCSVFGKNITVIDEGTELENVNGPFFAERDVTYEDIPEFPSWQVESAETRRIWGLPPVKAKPR